MARIPASCRPQTLTFHVATAYAVTDFAAFMAAVATLSVEGVFAYIGPFHVAALAASLYMYWFVSKVATLVCDEQPTRGAS